MTRIIKYFFCTLTIYCYQLTSLAQQNKIDSLLTLIKADKADTNKLNHLNKLGLEFYQAGSYDLALSYSNLTLQLCNTINKGNISPEISQNVLKIKASIYNNIGNVFKNKGNYSEALKNYNAGLIILETLGNKKAIAFYYNDIGNVYIDLGDYSKALKSFLTGLKIMESINDKKGIAKNLNNIGVLYEHQVNFSYALKNYFASLKIYEEIDDKAGIGRSYNNIGNVYQMQGNYPEALKKHFASLKIKQALGNKSGISYSYNNIGNVYYLQGNYTEALKNHMTSLKIKEALGDKTGFISSYFNIGTVLIKQREFKEAEEYLIKSIELSKKIGYKACMVEAYYGLTELDSAKGNFKGAYENHKLYILYRDSIDNEDTRKKTVQSQMTYDFEKKEAATQAEQGKKDVIAKEELKQKEQQRNYFVIGFALVGLLALFILRGYKQKQKANFIITQQKDEVEKSKHIIEEKNKDITDSINYAKRIQRATLPHRKEIWAAFPQSFLLFKPKDIVSGDFYFFHKNDHSAFIAVADCTGHGVPGAFMSMVGAGKLNDAVSESSDTSEILSLLNKGIKASLKQTDGNESTRDGMDIALCSVDTENRIIKYAGANRPLWIIRNGQTEVEEIKATKSAIGGLTDNNQHFETHEFKLLTGDTLYLFTDGFADQFGGGEGKKLMTKKFKEILLDIQGKSMKEQEQYLNSFIENWKAGIEQVDDILVIGIRL